MTRGLVRPTYAATTSRAVAGAVSCAGAAEVDWPTYVTGILRWDGSPSAGACWVRSYRVG